MATAIRAILEGKEPTMPKVPAAPTLFKTYEASGFAAALSQAKEFQAGTQYDAGSSELSRLADQLLAVGKPADALELAKKVAADAPRSESAAALLARASRQRPSLRSRSELFPGHRAERNAARVPDLHRRHPPTVDARCQRPEMTIGRATSRAR